MTRATSATTPIVVVVAEEAEVGGVSSLSSSPYMVRHGHHDTSKSSHSKSSSSNLTSSKHELKARLHAMRQSVEEKQRHVSSLFFGNNSENANDNTSNNSRFVFSIFDTGDSESDISYNSSSCRTLGTLDGVVTTTASPTAMKKNMQQQQSSPSSLLGAFHHHEDEAQQEQEQRGGNTTPSTTSPTTSDSTRDSGGSTRTPNDNDDDDDVESNGIEWTTDYSSDVAAAGVGGVDAQSNTGSLSTPIENMLGSRGKSMKQKKTKNAPIDDKGAMNSIQKQRQQQQQQRNHARNLTVPTGNDNGNGNDNNNQQYGQVGKSNRKSLLASCCCGGGKANGGDGMPDYDEHLGEGRQYWRDIILGVNDGLVSTFLLIAGVVGANLSSKDILLTALSGTIAGAISMAAGEYVATKTQQEVMDGEIALERKHIAKNRDFELLELKEAFGIIGIPEEDNSEEVVNLRRHLMNYYAKNDEAHVKVHAVLELGVVEEEKRNPFVAGGVAFFLFFFGAMPSVIPFLCTTNIESAFIAAAICTTTALLLVGAIKTWATRGSLLIASLENLLIAAGGGCIAYGVGGGFEKLVNG